MPRDDRSSGAGDGGSVRPEGSQPRARCVVLACPQRGVRADLATALGQRGAIVEVVFDAISAMTQLGTWHVQARQDRERSIMRGPERAPSGDPGARPAGTILLLVHPDELEQAGALTESVGAYFPEVTIATFGRDDDSRIVIERPGQVRGTEDKREPESAAHESPPTGGLPKVVVMPGAGRRARSAGPSLRLVKDDADAAPLTSPALADEDGQAAVEDEGEALVSAEELAMLLARDDGDGDDDEGQADPGHGRGGGL